MRDGKRPRGQKARRLTLWLVVLCVLVGAGGRAPHTIAQLTPTPAASGYRGGNQESLYTGSFADLAVAIDAFWSETLQAEGRPYHSPNVLPLEDVLDSACGQLFPEIGALYCALDGTIYLNSGFLAAQHQNVGDYAPITILAHEWGHHLQTLTNVPRPTNNQYELQADCLAGVYTQYAEAQGLLDPGDITEAVDVSGEFGDALGLPQDQPGAHGINDDRVREFMRGYLNGLSACGLPLGGGSPSSTVVAAPAPQSPQAIALPMQLPLAHSTCFRMEDEGTLSFEALAARLGGTDEAQSRLQDWGWHESAYRIFACDNPPEGEAGWIDISVHAFADAAAARQAVDYFAALRAEGTSLVSSSPPAIGDHAAVLSGPATNGTEFTLYASHGPVLIRVTGVSPTGIPFMDVLAVAREILAQSVPTPAIPTALPTATPPPPTPVPTVAVVEPSASTGITAYLPTALPLGHADCFQIADELTYDFPTLIERFPGVPNAESTLRSLGWQEGAYRQFLCENHPAGRADRIDMSIHRFGDASSAAAAVPFFASARALDTLLEPMPAAAIGDSATAIAGPSDVGREYTLYVGTGPLLLRVTGIAPDGDPELDVEHVMQALYADVLVRSLQDQPSNAPAPISNPGPTPPPMPASPAARETPLVDLLPEVSEVAEGIVVGEEGSRNLKQIADAFADPSEATQRLDEWGWTESAYRTFVPSGAVPRSVPTFEISVYRFTSDEGAAQALPYFVDARRDALGLKEIPADVPANETRAISGAVVEGEETSVYVRSGNVLAHISAVDNINNPHVLTALAANAAQAVIDRVLGFGEYTSAQLEYQIRWQPTVWTVRETISTPGEFDELHLVSDYGELRYRGKPLTLPTASTPEWTDTLRDELEAYAMDRAAAHPGESINLSATRLTADVDGEHLTIIPLPSGNGVVLVAQTRPCCGVFDRRNPDLDWVAAVAEVTISPAPWGLDVDSLASLTADELLATLPEQFGEFAPLNRAPNSFGGVVFWPSTFGYGQTYAEYGPPPNQSHGVAVAIEMLPSDLSATEAVRSIVNYQLTSGQIPIQFNLSPNGGAPYMVDDTHLVWSAPGAKWVMTVVAPSTSDLEDFATALIASLQSDSAASTPTAALLLPARSTFSSAAYTILDVGAGSGNWSSANHINNRGQVLWAWGKQRRVGELQPHSINNLHIMLWEDGTVTDLTGLGIDTASAINDVGMVLANAGDHTVVYQSDSGTISQLTAFDGGSATDINNAGTVVGVLNESAVIASVGSTETTPMPEGFFPVAINDAGQMVGSSADVSGGNARHPAFRFADGRVTLLPDSAGVEANYINDLNDAGQVVGSEGPPSLDAGIGGHAFLFDAVSGTITDIGALPGYENSIASGINTQGQAVGFAWLPRTRAYLYDHRSGLITDLNDLIPADSGWDLVFANDINDAGQIVGQGLIDGELHAYVLTPTG